MEQSILKIITSKVGTPVFIYSENTLLKNTNRIKEAIARSGLKNKVNINFSYFANSNPYLASILTGAGLGVTIQCVEENEHLNKLNVNIKKTVSPTHLSEEDMNYFIAEDTVINIGTFGNLVYAINKGVEKICIRVDLSPEGTQRQGFKPSQFAEIRTLLDKQGKKLHGIHIYPGTKNKLDIHLRYQQKSLECLKFFPELAEINLGGGFNYDYEAENNEDQHFNWDLYFHELKKRVEELGVNPNLDFTIEPGRDILADAGLFLLKINGVEYSPNNEFMEVFTDGSYVHMPSATIRARQHKLRFFDNNLNEILVDKIKDPVGMLSGNTTLSSDRVFPGLVTLPANLEEGYFILLEDTGAYCATQHMEFLNKRPAPEVLLKTNGPLVIISEKGHTCDRIRNIPLKPRVVGD